MKRTNTLNFLKRHNRLEVFILDAIAISCCFFLAYLLRFNLYIPAIDINQFWLLLPFVLAIKLTSFSLFHLYREMWRKVSLTSLKKIIAANVVASGIFGLIALIVIYGFVIPRSIVFIDFALCVLAIGGMRFLYRILLESLSASSITKLNSKRTLILGAGFLGESLVREMRIDKTSDLHPVAFLDDDETKIGKFMLDLPIAGRLDSLLSVVKAMDIDFVVIAIASLVGKNLRNVMALCDAAKKQYRIEYKIVPGNRAIIEGQVSFSQIREINVEDLLRREPVTIDTKVIETHLFDKTVLITGAAGSIGSELVRQVYNYLPGRLILIDKGESPLFYLQQELLRRKTNTQVNFIIGDVCNYEKMEAIFDKYKPDVIFHAAAYKHVPLMEDNPEEAIRNNIVSTLNLVQLANNYKTKNFIMISTDKAVRSTNIMGASKCIAEMIVQKYSQKANTIFTTVRFGNVIGSDGSLVPVLLNQIKRGGPVTVTHKDIVRYFMTIPEAVRLVTQAMVMGKGGDIFILDMGEPVKILSLAEDIIRLSGFEPYEQIDISFTGLRPGEKMYEELWNEGEETMNTEHPSIRRAVRASNGNQTLDGQLHELIKAAKVFNRVEIVNCIKAIVPDVNLQQTP
jgi:FlaA1/EpsC-like NDP-sugar epimerase